jgi:microcystin-dependent protein
MLLLKTPTMKKSNLITTSLLVVFTITLGGLLFTSSSTVDHSTSEAILELSTELADMKAELKNLKSVDENKAVSADPLLGEVTLFAGNFAPRGWAFCHGQLLSIASNSALFSILGTTYGGDGRTTFALPDLRGRSAIGVGNGPGLYDVRHGQKSGIEQVTLTINNLPSHSHSTTTNVPGFEVFPAIDEDSFQQGTKSFLSIGNDPNSRDTNILGNVSPTGGSQSFSVRNPYLGMNYIIALQGVFPSRS